MGMHLFIFSVAKRAVKSQQNHKSCPSLQIKLCKFIENGTVRESYIPTRLLPFLVAVVHNRRTELASDKR